MAEKLDAEEEMQVISSAQRGSSDAMERLLSANRAMLIAVANRLSATPTMRDELVQAGYIGLMQAVQRFQASQGARLTTYAMPWILGEMKKALRSALDATGAQEKRRELVRREAWLRASLGREPHLDELAHACKMDMQQIVQIEACACAPLSIEAGVEGDEEHASLLQFLSGGEEIDVDRLSLRMAINALNEEEQKIVYLRYFRDRTQKETASLLCKSQAQISKIERRALDRLRSLLA